MIKLDEYKPRGKAKYKRFILKCAHHAACSKKRSAASTLNHGPVEPIAYSYAWNAAGGSCTQAVHAARNFKVPVDEVSRWVVNIGDSAKELIDGV